MVITNIVVVVVVVVVVFVLISIRKYVVMYSSLYALIVFLNITQKENKNTLDLLWKSRNQQHRTFPLYCSNLHFPLYCVCFEVAGDVSI